MTRSRSTIIYVLKTVYFIKISPSALKGIMITSNLRHRTRRKYHDARLKTWQFDTLKGDCTSYLQRNLDCYTTQQLINLQSYKKDRNLQIIINLSPITLMAILTFKYEVLIANSFINCYNIKRYKSRCDIPAHFVSIYFFIELFHKHNKKHTMLIK